jgi:hypothetical protein
MKTATAVTALLLVLVTLSRPTPAAAQGVPFPTGGGNASPVLPGTESSGAPASNPLRAFVSSLTGYSSLGSSASAWMTGARTSASARASITAHAPRFAVRRASLVRNPR